MKNNVLLVLFVAGAVYAAQLDSLNRSSDVTTATELSAYAVDPSAIEARLDAIEATLAGGLTGDYANTTGFNVTNGVVKGTF